MDPFLWDPSHLDQNPKYPSLLSAASKITKLPRGRELDDGEPSTKPARPRSTPFSWHGILVRKSDKRLSKIRQSRRLRASRSKSYPIRKPGDAATPRRTRTRKTFSMIFGSETGSPRPKDWRQMDSQDSISSVRRRGSHARTAGLGTGSSSSPPRFGSLVPSRFDTSENLGNDRDLLRATENRSRPPNEPGCSPPRDAFRRVSSQSSGQSTNRPAFQFYDYLPHQSASRSSSQSVVKNIDQDIRAKMLSPLGKDWDLKWGYVYIWKDTNYTGDGTRYKIGYTALRVQTRSKPGYQPLAKQYFWSCRHAYRAEQLCHRELLQFADNSVSSPDGKRRKEHYLLSEEAAVQAVERWTAFVGRRPYQQIGVDGDGVPVFEIKPVWETRIREMPSSPTNEELADHNLRHQHLSSLSAPPIYELGYYNWFQTCQSRAQLLYGLKWSALVELIVSLTLFCHFVPPLPGLLISVLLTFGCVLASAGWRDSSIRRTYISRKRKGR